MSRIGAAFFSIILLAACSSREQSASQASNDARQARSTVAPASVAYSYTFRFAIPDTAIVAAQARHVGMCDRLGRARCRVLESHRSTGEYGDASLKLEVAAGLARGFGAALTPPVEALDGTLLSNDVAAEDVGRQIVDVQARLRAKQALVDRLNAALTTRPGSTADLVATEKAVADAQGDLDAARSELNLIKGRVAMFPFEIDYDQRRSFASRLDDAFANVSTTMSSSVVALIYFVAAVTPWVIAALLLFFGIRYALRRLRRRRLAGDHTPP